jgi:hypothetical protein
MQIAAAAAAAVAAAVSVAARRDMIRPYIFNVLQEMLILTDSSRTTNDETNRHDTAAIRHSGATVRRHALHDLPPPPPSWRRFSRVAAKAPWTIEYSLKIATKLAKHSELQLYLSRGRSPTGDALIAGQQNASFGRRNFAAMGTSFSFVCRPHSHRDVTQ